MANSSNGIDAELLSIYFPLNNLNKSEMEILASAVSVAHAKKGQLLVECGMTDNKAVLLVKGKLKLTAADGGSHTIEMGSEESLRPISHLSPHRYTVEAASAVDFIRIENKVIDNLMNKKAAIGDEAAEDLYVSRELLNNPVFMDIYRDLLDDNLVIPAFPDIAIKIQSVVEDEVDLRHVEQIIEFDPATAAMIVKAANCALFTVGEPVQSIEQAILRMGMKLVKQLVITYSMRELFQSEFGLINRRLKRMWKHSAEVAATSYVLAKKLGKWDPEHTLLLGLLHDIGMLPILSYVEKYPDMVKSEGTIDKLIQQFHGEVGGVILKAWNFSDDFITTSREADDWYRDNQSEPDYCDIVLLAQLHTFIGKSKDKINVMVGDRPLPAISTLPAYKKIWPDSYGPADSIDLLKEARQHIMETTQLLSLS